MKSAAHWERPVTIGGATGVIRVAAAPAPYIADPVLIYPEGGAYHHPMSIAVLIVNGYHELTYRWLADGMMVTAVLPGRRILSRHPYRPRFAVSDLQANHPKEQRFYDTMQIVVTSFTKSNRGAGFTQELGGLDGKVAQVHRLQQAMAEILGAPSDPGV